MSLSNFGNMQILPIHTPVLHAGDDIASALTSAFSFKDNDIVVISSKAIATVEGAAVDLSSISPSADAETWAERCGGSPALRQVILDETLRMNGRISVSTIDVMLTELKPDGMTEGSILVPNAGIDQSNIDEGFAVGWPLDPIASIKDLYEALGGKVGIIISDSGSRPRRLGVTAFALTVCGFDPIRSLKGSPDLFGKDLRISEEAVADQLATTANFLMGNSDKSMPAAVIRDHGVAMSDFCGWVPGIDKERDMFYTP